MAARHRPIVLIHGLFMSPHSWQGWIDRYAAQGYTVHAPAWPGVSELDEERDPAKTPPSIGIKEIADHYDEFIRRMGGAPIIMGHSIGGLVTQILLDRGLGDSGVAIHPAQPKGVLRLPLAALRAGWPVLRRPGSRRKPIMLSDRQFHYAFANSVSREE